MDLNILRKIPDSKPVRIFLPIKNSSEKFRLQGIYHKSDLPQFNLLFKKGTLPLDSIDLTGVCIVNVDMGGPTVSLEAEIKGTSNNQMLNMVAIKSISHEQLREFFRVDTVTKVIGRSFQPQVRGAKGEEWNLSGETIDISGSGLLASFSQKPPASNQIVLEITLPTFDPEVIKVIAHPVRTIKTAENQYDIAYHFDEITTEDRDKIIGCCLEIQRKLLRLKVQVKDL